MKCATCKFFNEAGSECRRYAPQPTDDTMKAKWPSVASTDWCGEYEHDASKSGEQAA